MQVGGYVGTLELLDLPYDISFSFYKNRNMILNKLFEIEENKNG